MYTRKRRQLWTELLGAGGCQSEKMLRKVSLVLCPEGSAMSQASIGLLLHRTVLASSWRLSSGFSAPLRVTLDVGRSHPNIMSMEPESLLTY